MGHRSAIEIEDANPLPEFLLPGLTVTHAQALRDLRDYFCEAAALEKRSAGQCSMRGCHSAAYMHACKADAYEHAMDMTIAYLGETTRP